MKLSQLKQGQKAIICKIVGHGAFRKRLIEMGFVRGKEITPILSAPLRDPVKYTLMGYEVSLRRSEADLVEVEPISDTTPETTHPHTSDEEIAQATPAAPPIDAHRTINIALIGNPNCGKTSLFNVASGAREHVGNYSGVTVEAKQGSFAYGGYHFNIVDLPGTYSLSCYSPEELYVRRYLHTETPDVIVNVVVASNLERNLYLTTELIDMDRSMVIAMNMYDEFQTSGLTLDYQLLGAMIGVPVVPTVTKTGQGVNDLFDAIIKVYEDRHEAVRHVHVNLGDDIEAPLRDIKNIIKSDRSLAQQFSPRYLAIKFLEQDSEAESILMQSAQYPVLVQLRDAARTRIEHTRGEDVTAAIAAEKYGFIDGALAETMHGDRTTSSSRATSIIDAFVTNRLFGIPLFLALMLLIFWLTFQIGSYPMTWIDTLVAWLGSHISAIIPPGPLADLISDGIIGGVGSVIVFLPNILILYFCISFMEDSGYMARAAFIMDRAMHKIGLHGKSFIPLIMGFGCNVPAIMATRAIESRSSRLITILINPFMSCSARLPIYILLVGTFFSSHAALIFFALYLIGVAAAILTARLLRRFVWPTDETPFVMELPPYRVPTLKSTLRHMWTKAQQYLKKMGGIIMVGCIVVWALNYYPRHTDSPQAYSQQTEQIDPASDSYLQMMGKAINPIMRPLGFHWRATVAAIAGIPAKEIVVSTLGVLYTGSEDTEDSSLGQRLSAPATPGAEPDFTPAAALAFMVFILLYCPCIATIAAIYRETGSWRYPAASIIWNTTLAWILSFLTYRLALLF